MKTNLSRASLRHYAVMILIIIGGGFLTKEFSSGVEMNAHILGRKMNEGLMRYFSETSAGKKPFRSEQLKEIVANYIPVKTEFSAASSILKAADFSELKPYGTEEWRKKFGHNDYASTLTLRKAIFGSTTLVIAFQLNSDDTEKAEIEGISVFIQESYL